MPSTIATSPPIRATAWPSSTPTGPAPSTRQAAGHLAQARRLAVGPDARQAAETGDGRDRGVRARRDDDVRGEIGLLADDDAAGAVEASGAPDDLDPRALRPRRLTGVPVVADHEVAPREDGRRIRAAAVDGLGRAGRLARGLERLAGAQQRLGRDAAPVRALAAEQLALHDRDPQAAVRQPRGAVLAGRPAAEDDDVEGGAHADPLALSISFAAVIRPMWL